VEGVGKLEPEIEACQRLDPRNRFFLVNARHVNEQTGEVEDGRDEVVVERRDKISNY